MDFKTASSSDLTATQQIFTVSICPRTARLADCPVPSWLNCAISPDLSDGSFARSSLMLVKRPSFLRGSAGSRPPPACRRPPGRLSHTASLKMPRHSGRSSNFYPRWGQTLSQALHPPLTSARDGHYYVLLKNKRTEKKIQHSHS
jgi:hypothetical protein